MQMATRGETTKSTKHRRVAHRTASFHLALTSCSGRPKIHQRSQSQELFWLIWTCFLPCWPMGVQLPTFNFTWGSWPSTYSIPTSPTHASKRVLLRVWHPHRWCWRMSESAPSQVLLPGSCIGPRGFPSIDIWRILRQPLYRATNCRVEGLSAKCPSFFFGVGTKN